MKKNPATNYIKTKVVIEFANQTQAEAFFNIFHNPREGTPNGLALMSNYLSETTVVKKIEYTKELKHNYLIKLV